MPVYQIKCPDCGHEFQSLVMKNAKLPEKWFCSRCEGYSGAIKLNLISEEGPLEGGPHGKGCRCCL